MQRGYIKIWRKIEDSGLIQNAAALQFAVWCLLKASHKKRKQIVGASYVDIESGQFVFGRKAAAKELNTTEQRIRTSLKLLKNIDFLTIRSTNKYSIISVVNWATYQEEQPAANQQPNHQSTSSQPPPNHKQTCKHVSIKENSIKDTVSENEVSGVVCPQKQITELWNNTMPELPQVKAWGGQSQKNLRARWKSDPEYQSVEWWERFFVQIRGSDYLMGRINGWQVSLDWLVKPSNFQKIINGQYRNRNGPPPRQRQSPAQQRLLNNAQAAEEFLNG